MDKQLTLGELITLLEQAPQDLVVERGFGRPRSYRGYYDQIAFEHARDVQVADMLTDAKDAVGETFLGYKGGNFHMTVDTLVNIANHGECSMDDLDQITTERVAKMLTSVSGNPAKARVRANWEQDVTPIAQQLREMKEKLCSMLEPHGHDERLYECLSYVESAQEALKGPRS